ncbi:uncharacterized protein J4E88_003277 [Alternaria novae-zelandiae]|uniref:uncharacterized protein n=1 Tax=Alternaria novae-zelandiae TaxID=430562 RepID=UPI0020C53523|nr:uncharacterized protein J4E88_003277 [Alternaria novae-zelandiae]KAI4687686.1 hypothetical protein J4E88_003277 [Alternaria novae-zelandiae]
MESLGSSSSGGYDSYVYVEHSDAETSDEFCRATDSTGDAEQHENYANASVQDLDQQWLEHKAHQNGPYADQFGYSQSSPSGYSLRSGGGPAYTTDGQCAHQTQEFEPGQPFDPCQGPVMYAGDGSADLYPQYAAPAGHNDRGLGVTQPLYNFPDLRQPCLTYNPYTEDNNTMPARRNPVVIYPIGSRTAECPQGARHKNLEQHVNQLMDVLNTPGVQVLDLVVYQRAQDVPLAQIAITGRDKDRHPSCRLHIRHPDSKELKDVPFPADPQCTTDLSREFRAVGSASLPLLLGNVYRNLPAGQLRAAQETKAWRSETMGL